MCVSLLKAPSLWSLLKVLGADRSRLPFNSGDETIRRKEGKKKYVGASFRSPLRPHRPFDARNETNSPAVHLLPSPVDSGNPMDFFSNRHRSARPLGCCVQTCLLPTHQRPISLCAQFAFDWQGSHTSNSCCWRYPNRKWRRKKAISSFPLCPTPFSLPLLPSSTKMIPLSSSKETERI